MTTPVQPAPKPLRTKPILERWLETALFRSRWLMAPFYVGLIMALAALVFVFFNEAWHEFQHIPTMSPEQAILLALSLIDLSLAGNLLLIVTFSGYENFVSKIDTGDDEDRPGWMGTVDFAGLKLKLIASIVAISGIALLKAFMQLAENEPMSDRNLAWLVGIHLTFVVSGVMLALMDLLAAHQLKEGLLTALYQREKTGRGTLVQVSLLDSALASLANQASTFLVTGHDPQPLGSGHPGIVPYGTVYRTADGQRIVLAVGTDAQFGQLCAVLQRPHWATEPRFASNPARVAHRAALEELLTQRIAELSGAGLLHELTRLAVPAGAVRTVGEALTQLSAQAMLLPPTAEFPYAGLRTVAFRAAGWPVAAALSAPPPLPPALDEDMRR